MRTLKYSIAKHGVTQSILTGFLKCLAYSKYSLKGLEPKRPKGRAFMIGDLVHEVLARLYMKGKRPSRASVKRTIKEAAFALQITDKEVIGLCRLLCLEYFKFWKSDFKKITWEATEQEFTNHYKELDIPLRGKFDAVFSISKTLWLLETKTRSIVNIGNLIKLLPFDFQCMFYLLNLWIKTKKKPAGVLYNIIRKPAIRQRVNESYKEYLLRVKQDIRKRPKWYFVRVEVMVTKEEIERFKSELDEILARFIAWRKGDIKTVRNSTACEDKYGLCKFADLCRSGSYAGYEVKDRFNKELAKEAV